MNGFRSDRKEARRKLQKAEPPRRRLVTIIGFQSYKWMTIEAGKRARTEVTAVTVSQGPVAGTGQRGRTVCVAATLMALRAHQAYGAWMEATAEMALPATMAKAEETSQAAPRWESLTPWFPMAATPAEVDMAAQAEPGALVGPGAVEAMARIARVPRMALAPALTEARPEGVVLAAVAATARTADAAATAAASRTPILTATIRAGFLQLPIAA